MTSQSLAAVKSASVEQRKRIRQQRRLRFLQACWQMSLLTAAVGGLVFTFRLPFWLIQNTQQVQIRGNQTIKTEFILDQLSLQYPVSLLQIHPDQVSAGLRSQVPVVNATVTRQLWPATLRVEVQERLPVALTIPGPPLPSTKTQDNPPATERGVLDAQGMWVSTLIYKKPEILSEQAPIRVLGFQDPSRQYWPQIYQALRSSPVKVTTIDWRNSQNVILSTDLGTVHLGPYTPQLSEQLQRLDQMRQLPDQMDPQRVDYIDLANPSLPSVHLKKNNKKI